MAESIKTEDEVVFGKDQWIYCSQHLRAHTTGWCKVSVRDKLGLGVIGQDREAQKSAFKKCREFKLEIFEEDKPLRPYLIQRLKRRPASKAEGKITQVFGGSALLLTDDAWDVLQTAFNIDYMCKAEFEFGVLPKCLNQIISGFQLYHFWSFTLQSDQYADAYWRETYLREARVKNRETARAAGKPIPRFNPKKALALVPEKQAATIYVISPSMIKDEVVAAMIRGIAMDDDSLCLPACMSRVLDPSPGQEPSELVGWLSLDHRLFWFTDAETAQLTWTMLKDCARV